MRSDQREALWTPVALCAQEEVLAGAGGCSDGGKDPKQALMQSHHSEIPNNISALGIECFLEGGKLR